MKVDKDKLIEDLELHLGKDDAVKLLSKLKDMHTKGSSPEELQDEIINTIKEKCGSGSDEMRIICVKNPPHQLLI